MATLATKAEKKENDVRNILHELEFIMNTFKY